MGNSIQTTCVKRNEPELFHCETCYSSFKFCIKCFEENHKGHLLVEERNEETPAAVKVPVQTNKDILLPDKQLFTENKITDDIGADSNNIAETEVEEFLKSIEENKELYKSNDIEGNNQPHFQAPELDMGNEILLNNEVNECLLGTLKGTTDNQSIRSKSQEDLVRNEMEPSATVQASRLQAHFKTKPERPTKSVSPSEGKKRRSTASVHGLESPGHPSSSVASVAYKSDSDMSSAVCPEPVMTTRQQTTSPSSFASSSPQLVWWEYYALLLQWGDSHSDYNVPPGSMVTLQNGSRQDLGLWLKRQKSYLGKMVDEKYDALAQLAESGRLWGGDANDLQASSKGVESTAEARLGGNPLRGWKTGATAAKRGSATSFTSSKQHEQPPAAKKAKTEEKVTPKLTLGNASLTSIGPNRGQRRIEGITSVSTTVNVFSDGEPNRESGSKSIPKRMSEGYNSNPEGASSRVSSHRHHTVIPAGPSIGAPGFSSASSMFFSSYRVSESDRDGHRTGGDTSDSQQVQYRHHSHHGHHLHHHATEKREGEGDYHYVAFAYSNSDMPAANDIKIAVGCVEYTPNYQGNEVLTVLKAMLIPVDDKHFLSGLFVSENQDKDILIDKDAIIAKHLKVRREEGRDEDLYQLSESSQRKIKETHTYKQLYERKF